jgi:hypothetical protein
VSLRVALAGVGALVLVLVHAGLLGVAAQWSFVAALLSPGAHSGPIALLFGVGFLSARLLLYVVLPSLAAGTLVFLGVSRASRPPSPGRNSPNPAPGPMLSAPDGDPEVTDGDAR